MDTKKLVLRDVGSVITSYRKTKSMTQTDLGNKMGLKKSQVCKIEKGENLTIATISRAFSALGIDANLTIEPEISDENLRPCLDDIVMTVSEFAKTSGLSNIQAFKYLDTFGGIEHLLLFHESIKNESLNNTIEDLIQLCRNRGGKL